MIAALNSTDDDIFECPTTGNIMVTGKNLEGECIILGEITPMEIYANCRRSFEHVRFRMR